MQNQLKVGIFGGTYNPIHFGHLINIEIIKNDFNLDAIMIVPTKISVHKSIEEPVSVIDRCKMIEAAIDKRNDFQLSRIEIDRDEPSFTITTVQELIKRNPQIEYYLIIGYDSFADISNWKDYNTLIKAIPIIVMNRPDERAKNEDTIKKAKKIMFAENPLIDISSTYIRKRLEDNKSVRYLMPDSVLKYIKEKGLYQN